MNQGRTVFAQLLDGIDRTELERCARQFPMLRTPHVFSAYDHFASMLFAQLTYRQSLPHRAGRSTLSRRHSRQGLAQQSGVRQRAPQLAGFCGGRCGVDAARRRLCQRGDRPALLAQDIFAFDASLIDLSLALCPWAHRQQSQAAVRLNVLLDTKLDVPDFASISEGDRHEVHALDEVPIHPGAFYIMDRGYVDFARLHRLHQGQAFFLVRARSNLRFCVRRSTKIDRTKGLRCDQQIRLTRRQSTLAFPAPLRRIRYRDPTSGTNFVFLTNHLELEAFVVTELYRCRWHVELFFRWIKQHLRLRWFFATSPNGIRVQIWCALCAHLLVAIARERHRLDASLYQILQIVSVCIWEKSPLPDLLTKPIPQDHQTDFCELLKINNS